MNSRRISLTVAVALLIVGCSPSAPPAASTHPGSPQSSGTPPVEVTPSVLVTAAPVATDRTVALAPLTYSDPASPCHAQMNTATLATALPDCGDAWLGLNPQKVAGNDLMATAPMPRQAQVAAGTDSAAATSLATAFYESQMLHQFAEQDNNATLLALLDTAPYETSDRVLAFLQRPGNRATSVPACMLPTSIRVAPSTAAITAYLTGLGWPQPSSTAIVVNYAACPGITFTASDGTTFTNFGQKTAAAAIFTGQVQSIAPFGEVWVTDGTAICGEPQLRTLCGA